MCKKYLLITALSVMCVIHLSYSAGGYMGSGSSGSGAWGMYNILIAPHIVGSSTYYQVILKAPFSNDELLDRGITPSTIPQKNTFVYDPTTTTGKKITTVILSALSSGLPICICVSPSTPLYVSGYGNAILASDVSLATY